MKVTDEMIEAAIAHKYGDVVANEKMTGKMRALLNVAIQAAWVSVEDRLPEIGVEVIITTKHGHVSTDHRRPFSGTWYYDGSHNSITHWMPMPEFKGVLE